MPSPASRDHGLRRVNTATRWIAGGSIVLAGGFAALVAKALPGRAASNGSAATTVPPPSTTPTSSTDGGTSSSTGGAPSATSSSTDATTTTTTLAPPQTTPAPVNHQPASVSSGGT